MSSNSLISVIDDDESVRESLEGLLKSADFRVKTFPGAQEFLSSGHIERTDCLILDVRLEGMSGPELQRVLIASNQPVPIVFITAHADEGMRRRFLADGAVDCLLKPFTEDALLAAVDSALRLAGRPGSKGPES
ncbi:MAG: response regulator [Terrimicrobium sp.]|jgi:FixJ family two-component response regulator